MKAKWPTVGVSYSREEQWLIDAAKAKARRQRQSFSQYVAGLIEKDLSPTGTGFLINEASSSNIQDVKDARIDSVNYTIRKQRKPSS